MPEVHSNSELFLICRSARHLCALPLDKVREIMRPLPLERVAQDGPAAPFVLGASIVRGAVVPALSLAGLLGGSDTAQHGRYVSLRLGERDAVLAVDSVLGVGNATQTEGIAPLLGAVEHAAVAAITLHDTELLYVLQAAKLIPDSVWASGEAA
ncbi:MAG: chemotaxis protein CheW [Burkholderiaceae bacterium]|nr:chemotaxis protein CheW [Burkholderiaceae bacterium]